MNLENDDTIIAIATPPGEGGIGIIRLSGGAAENLLLRFFESTRTIRRFESHRLYHGRVLTPDKQVVDEVMAVIMRGPHSYTREDVVEIHCHGGRIVQRRILQLLVDAGARLAKPGEFTLRAFLNGRLDLASAEAVIDVIQSRSEAASRVAIGQLTGKLSQLIYAFRDVLVDLLTEVEADIDFPEEALELSARDLLCARGYDLVKQMQTLLDSFETGRVLKEGLSVLIFGKPNVGKSSLMNRLLGEARTIVTDIPGTTRDVVEENLVLGGLPLRLVDTAGIRETADQIEAEGVRRAREKVAGSDLVLLVVDGSRPLDSDDFLALQSCQNAQVVLVINKQDLGLIPLSAPFDQLSSVTLSTLQGEGLTELQYKICELFCQEGGKESLETVLISDARHRQAILKARVAVGRFLEGFLSGLSPEFGALDLREALDALGEITGETTPEDILERIFLRFCVGK